MIWMASSQKEAPVLGEQKQKKYSPKAETLNHWQKHPYHFERFIISVPSRSRKHIQNGTIFHRSEIHGGGASTRAMTTTTCFLSSSASTDGSSDFGRRVKMIRVREKRGCPSSSKHPAGFFGKQPPNAASSLVWPTIGVSFCSGISKASRAFPWMFAAATCPAWTCLIRVL